MILESVFVNDSLFYRHDSAVSHVFNSDKTFFEGHFGIHFQKIPKG